MNVNLGVLIRLMQKNTMLEFLRIIEDRLIYIFSTPSIIKKVSSTNQKGYVHDKLKRIWRVKIHATPSQFLILLNLKG